MRKNAFPSLILLVSFIHVDAGAVNSGGHGDQSYSPPSMGEGRSKRATPAAPSPFRSSPKICNKDFLKSLGYLRPLIIGDGPPAREAIIGDGPPAREAIIGDGPPARDAIIGDGPPAKEATLKKRYALIYRYFKSLDKNWTIQKGQGSFQNQITVINNTTRIKFFFEASSNGDVHLKKTEPSLDHCD